MYINDKLYASNVNLRAVVKWQTELYLRVQFDWKKLFHLPFKVTKKTSLRWLQFRMNHRILGTNDYLFKMKLTENKKCTFCQDQPETIKHIFWECEHERYFWDSFILL